MFIWGVPKNRALPEEIGASSIKEMSGNLRLSQCEEHLMFLMFSRGFKDIITKSAKCKEFPGLENKCQNSRGFKEINE